MAVLERRTGQVDVSAESRAERSAHGFWKRGTTYMFAIIISNLDACYYLRMAPEMTFAKVEKKKKDSYLQAFM